MSDQAEFIPCSLMQPPGGILFRSAEHTLKINPLNRAATRPSVNGVPAGQSPRLRRPLLRLLLCASMLPVGGCATYLHNPERAAATADLQANFGALSTPSYFEAQEKNLVDFARREDRTLAELLIASRGYRLLNVIKPATTVEDKKSTAPDRLRGLVAADLQLSYGEAKPTPDQRRALMVGQAKKDRAVRTAAFNARRIASAIRSYQASGGKLPVDCPTVLAGVQKGARGRPTDLQGRRYQQLAEACQAQADRETLMQDCDSSRSDGDLKSVCARINVLDEDKATEARRDALKSAREALQEAAKAAAKPSEQVKAVQAAQTFLASVEKYPTNEQLSRVLARLETVFGDSLGAELTRLRDSAAGKLPSATAPLINALELIKAMEGYRDAQQRRPLDMPSALLIGLAKVRHDLNLLEIDLAAEQQERELLTRQAALLRTQLYYLAQADAALAASDETQAVDEAISYYVRSQDAGRIPFELLRFREIQLKRETALKKARATEADYRALLQPAIDQLAAYGAGGVKSETIADFLAGLPVAGSILAE